MSTFIQRLVDLAEENRVELTPRVRQLLLEIVYEHECRLRLQQEAVIEAACREVTKAIEGV